MSPMSKGAFYGRTGVGQPGPSRVKIQDWLADGFLLLCSLLRESLSTAIMADLAWAWSESQKSRIIACIGLSLRQLGSCFIWVTPLSCAHQPLNGKAVERASFPVYSFHILSALIASIPLSEGYKTMPFPSRRTSDYQNHSTQNACFISVLFSSFWILYSNIGSFLLQWDISEGYKLWPPFEDYLVYLILHPYPPYLAVCLWASFSKVCIFTNQWHFHLWDSVCGIYLISWIWEHFWKKAL